MIALKVENGDLKIENGDLVLLEGKEKAKQDIVELIKHIKGTYELKKEIGIPWYEYIGQLKATERENLIMTYMYDKVANYPGIDLSSINVEKISIENRESNFRVNFSYLGENVDIGMEGKYLNG